MDKILEVYQKAEFVLTKDLRNGIITIDVDNSDVEYEYISTTLFGHPVRVSTLISSKEAKNLIKELFGYFDVATSLLPGLTVVNDEELWYNATTKIGEIEPDEIDNFKPSLDLLAEAASKTDLISVIEAGGLCHVTAVTDDSTTVLIYDEESGDLINYQIIVPAPKTDYPRGERPETVIIDDLGYNEASTVKTPEEEKIVEEVLINTANNIEEDAVNKSFRDNKEEVEKEEMSLYPKPVPGDKEPQTVVGVTMTYNHDSEHGLVEDDLITPDNVETDTNIANQSSSVLRQKFAPKKKRFTGR